MSLTPATSSGPSLAFGAFARARDPNVCCYLTYTPCPGGRAYAETAPTIAREDYYLVISAFAPYKRVDLAV